MTLPGGSVAISATVVERDGKQYVSTVCQDCGKPVTLSCELPDGSSVEPDDQALKHADMIVCNSCDSVEQDRRAERDRTASARSRVHDAKLPSSFRNLSFDDMDRSGERGRAVAAAWAWADAGDHDGAGLLLWGPPGTGKTRLAATAVLQRLQSRPVRYCSVAHLIASLQASFSDDDRKDALHVLTGNRALVLDDLDKVKPTETAQQQLFVAIDRRVQAGAPLFVTSNAAPHRLSEKFGEAIVSRLAGYCQVLEFAGRDRRLGR